MQISTAIAYVNGNPHIGFAYELIAADALARAYRNENIPVLFTTGTDEHGQKISAKANSIQHFAGREKDFVDINVLKFIELAQSLNISYNDFVRTTSTRHKKTVNFIWNKLNENGFLYEGDYVGWYSQTDESFYSLDQCYKVGDDYFAKETNSLVIPTKERNIFFKLSAFKEQILEWYTTNPIYPSNRTAEIVNIVKNELQDLSVTRPNVQWGIPVPGKPDHTIYVWIDALTNYLTSLGYPEYNWEEHWPATHVIGKDILKFHAIYWPAILLAVGLPLPKKIVTHGWILDANRNKMAKSVGNVIDPIDVIETYGVDALRYYLLKEISFGEDGEFSYEGLNKANNELANEFGNLINRFLAVVHKNTDGVIKFDNFNDIHEIYYDTYRNAAFIHYTNYNFSAGINEAFKLIKTLNALFQNEEPWKLFKTDETKYHEIIDQVFAGIIVASDILEPIIPTAIKKIRYLLNVMGPKLNKPFIIFKKQGEKK